MRLRTLPLLLAATAAVALAQPQPTPEELGQPPRVEFDHAKGSFAVRFGVPSGELPELARPAAMLARLRAGATASVPDPPLRLEEELFFVHVPDGYARETPYGLLVWISPTEFGGTVRPELRALLAERRLIWVGAHRSGNERARLDRHALALVAATEAPRHWSIDPARIVVAGYSGGGRTASQLAFLWPELFRGALFVRGVNWYERLAVPGEAGRFWPASFAPPPKAALKLARAQPYVFLTGELDFNRPDTLATAAAAKRAGFRRTKTIDLPGLDHVAPIPIEAWREALEFLP